METPAYTLRQLVYYFIKLGTTGFGGPVALVGYMHRDLVGNKRWMTDEEYKEGLALAQLAPGPLAAQLCIYLGFVHYRLIGATICGLAFIFPSFVMVVVLGVIYKQFNGLQWMQAAFYGIGAAVIGIVVHSTYKLTTKSISNISWPLIKQHWMRWLLYGAGAAITVITQQEQVILFVMAGITYMIVKAPPQWIKQPPALQVVLLLITGFWQYDWPVLGRMAWFFTKAGAFVFGSGLAIVPFLHAGVVSEFNWLNEQQFLDAVAVAMITPGPVVITVGFIGYLVSGFPGASVAALATFLPCYLFTVVPAPYFHRISKLAAVKAFVEGITAAVIGALLGAVIVIAMRSITDIPTALMAIAALCTLVYFKRIKEPVIIVIAAIVGLAIKTLN